ncbi:MAG: FtsX-like permease family protein [Thermoproteales archaeon]|nr:FtsX-like permease family protein [Thermoproteales archaeon]
MLGREGFVNYIFIKIDDRKLINDVARAIKRNYPGADIVKQTDIVNVIIKVMDIIDGMLMAVTVIGLLVAALGVMNTVMMSIRERIREIGILKTIGAGGTHVLLIFLSEVIIMGVSGGVLGIVAGYSGSFILRDFVNSLGLAFEIPILLVPEAFMLGFCVSLTVSILAALYPIYKAVKIRPIEALKIE